MCLLPWGEVVKKKKKKSRQYSELEIVPWAKGRCWARTQFAKRTRRREEGQGKKVEKASMAILQELIIKSQWNPAFVIIQERIGKI